MKHRKIVPWFNTRGQESWVTNSAHCLKASTSMLSVKPSG